MSSDYHENIDTKAHTRPTSIRRLLKFRNYLPSVCFSSTPPTTTTHRRYRRGKGSANAIQETKRDFDLQNSTGTTHARKLETRTYLSRGGGGGGGIARPRPFPWLLLPVGFFETLNGTTPKCKGTRRSTPGAFGVWCGDNETSVEELSLWG